MFFTIHCRLQLPPDVRAGLCNGAAGLSLGNRATIKKIPTARNSGRTISFFRRLPARKIKHSPNCLRILILSGYRKSAHRALVEQLCFRLTRIGILEGATTCFHRLKQFC
jgi:hypothetical protein